MSTQPSSLPTEIINGLREIYDIGEWLALERTPKGRANDSYFVTASSGRYVLRASPARKSLESIEFEVALIEHLRKHGYPAPLLIPTRQGRRYAERDHTLYVLTAFIPGVPCDSADVYHLAAAGRGLGRFHRLVQSFPVRYGSRLSTVFTRLWPDGARRLAEARAVGARLLRDDERGHLDEACAYIERQFPDVHRALLAATPGLGRLIIHGSFGRPSLIFEGGRLRGVVDYDRASYDLRGLDIVYALKSFCHGADDDPPDYWVGLDEARCHRFLMAYQEEEPLRPEEIRALPLLSRAQLLRKVLNKCENFLAKSAAAPQHTKDMQKLATIVERSAARLRWLERHGRTLGPALAT